ncbi:uncharacterized protein LOC108666815 [Hyalella azteca]|uniref:Uncharacterized protein LOC108666815 n=1 Tax=Hyalella azteca TaxID=294128 RepID=A0A8B7N5V1_HYAAZ|nr:uncharacterized protein LOC108666815 [Hyalella azteca]
MRLSALVVALLMATACEAMTLEELSNMVMNNPEQLCDVTTCQEPYSASECPPGTHYLDGYAVGGCCGACVRFQQEGEACTGRIDDRICQNKGEDVPQGYGMCDGVAATRAVRSSIMSRAATGGIDSLNLIFESPFDLLPVDNILSSSWCDYGMYCTNKKCAIQNDWVTCKITSDAYDRDLSSGNYISYRDDYRYRPQCSADGRTFAPKQCKSSPQDSTKTCVCVDPNGNTIEGKAFSFQKELFEDMNCLCARRQWELQQIDPSLATLHCLTNGNYERVQCEGGWCYCVHPENGTVYGYQMPEPAMNLLKCFNKTQIGDLYLRQCESRAHAHQVFVSTMRNKGVQVPPSDPVACSIEGAYATRQCVGSGCTCKNKYNADCLSKGEKNCNCIADRLAFLESGVSYDMLQCGESQGGYYEPVQKWKSLQALFYVDDDGIRKGPVMSEGCETYMKQDNMASCQVLGNLIDPSQPNPNSWTYCDEVCTNGQGGGATLCQPSNYLYNSGNFAPSSSSCP